MIRLRRLARDARGVAAVEFALIFPIMLLLYVGVIDVTRGVIASRKLNLLSRTVSDLVSQQPTTVNLTIPTLSTILAASTAVMDPFPTTGLRLTVTAVDIKYIYNTTTCCNVRVRWTYTQAGDKKYLRTCGTALTQVDDGVKPSFTNFPKSLVSANSTQKYYDTNAASYMIIADASYTYTPFFLQAVSWFANGMSKTTFMVPRAPSNPVVIDDPSTATSPQLGVICPADRV